MVVVVVVVGVGGAPLSVVTRLFSQPCVISTLMQWDNDNYIGKTVHYKITNGNTTGRDELKTKTAFHIAATRACTNTTYTRRAQNNVLQQH